MQYKEIQDRLTEVNFPTFEEFLRNPNNPLCPKLDSRRLLVEYILRNSEYTESQGANKLLMGGEVAMVLRYKREKDGIYRPACILSFDITQKGINITQLQGSNDRIAFRFDSGFDSVLYFAKVIEESFIKKGLKVEMEQFPEGLENASYSSQAQSRYERLRIVIQALQEKHLQNERISE